ncbi:hypothetical protein [Pandoraea apista]|uniref:hypothetical protein n=1 Tax=Pandoraea apista TaxID=93218 RepID=UPI000F68044E|nr:hypothetical protein [Pandoraea apista]RRW91040.1 hypothetical protein EGJ54_21610 [Pandoraea apista]RRX00831.1 hypothetical protein EGJ56_18270 [Pandoraea apista]
MNLSELLDTAARKQGTLGAVAHEFGFEQSRLSAWRKGTRKPSAGEILMLAELAELPPLTTLVEIEQSLDEKHSSIWQRALNTLRSGELMACRRRRSPGEPAPQRANALITGA